MTVGGITTGKRGDFGALPAINHDRPAGTRRVVEAGQPSVTVTVAPGGDGVVIDSEGGSDGGERLAAVEFEQGGGAFEGPGGQRAFRQQGFEPFTMLVGEGDMLFLHPDSLPAY